MFIAALFTIGKLWNQPRCPPTDEWIKKIWYIYTMEYYLAIKKKLHHLQMDRTGDHHLSEIRQTWKDKGQIFSLICGM
jgi:hypothetical protein